MMAENSLLQTGPLSDRMVSKTQILPAGKCTCNGVAYTGMHIKAVHMTQN